MHELIFNVPSKGKDEVQQALLFLLKSRYGKDYKDKYNLMHDECISIIDGDVMKNAINKYYLPKLLTYNCDILYTYYSEIPDSLNIGFEYAKGTWKLNEKKSD